MSDGDICTMCFFLLLTALVAFYSLVTPDGYPTTTDDFDPETWCPIECMGDSGQAHPCDDCPYLGPCVPRHMKEEE